MGWRTKACASDGAYSAGDCPEGDGLRGLAAFLALPAFVSQLARSHTSKGKGKATTEFTESTEQRKAEEEPLPDSVSSVNFLWCNSSGPGDRRGCVGS